MLHPAGELYVGGSGSFAVEVAEWARDAGWTVVGLVELLDLARVGVAVAGYPVVGYDAPPAGGLAVIAIGGSRREHESRLQACGWRAATLGSRVLMSRRQPVWVGVVSWLLVRLSAPYDRHR